MIWLFYDILRFSNSIWIFFEFQIDSADLKFENNFARGCILKINLFKVQSQLLSSNLFKEVQKFNKNFFFRALPRSKNFPRTFLN